MTGAAVLYKPRGMRSFELIRQLKGKYPGLKFGHAGTLDEFAEGLMLVLLGSATGLYEQCTGLEKTYAVDIVFGEQTDTLDPLGTVVSHAPLPDHQKLQEAIAELQGSVAQTPPEYSAVHVRGQRAWQRVRRGESVKLPSRQIQIEVWDASYAEGHLSLNMKLSRGGYVRSYARDLAHRAGSCAYVQGLIRTRIGPFMLAESLPLSDFFRNETFIALLPLCRRLGISITTLNEEGREKVLCGKELRPEDFGGFPDNISERLAVSKAEDCLVWVRAHHDRIRYRILSTLPVEST